MPLIPKGLNEIQGLPTGTPDAGDLISYIEVIEEVAATAAGTATDVGTAGETITVGGKTYTVVAADPEGDEIEVGASAAGFAANIAAKVTEDTAETLCTCEDTVDALLFTANTPGAAGNDIVIETTDPDLTLDAEFAGGVTASQLPKVITVEDFATVIDGILNP